MSKPRWPLALCIAAVAAAPLRANARPLECMERFRFQEFMIGAWWSVSDDEEAVRLYRDAGFNVDLQSCRYEVRKDDQLALAERLGLKVMIDTLIQWPPGDPGNNHWATLEELKWLHGHYGDHPAVIGYLVNDNCSLDERTQQVAKYVSETAPGLMVWVSTNPDPNLQATIAGRMPILTSQNYPYLYDPGGTESARRAAYCSRLEMDRQHANRHNMCLWPFVNVAQPEGGLPISGSQARFQAFASIAYGAQGLPYFHYWHHLANADGPTPLYKHVRACNRYLSDVVGPRVLGHRSIGAYHTSPEMPAGAMQPAPGRLIESMSPDLLVGVLVAEADLSAGRHRPHYLMVLDKRTVTAAEDEPADRVVRIAFSPDIKGLRPLRQGTGSRARMRRLGADRTLTLNITCGEGVLVEVWAQ